MDDTTFTIAFAKGYALGVLIKLKIELKKTEKVMILPLFTFMKL